MLFFHLDTTFSFRDKHRVKKKLIFSDRLLISFLAIIQTISLALRFTDLFQTHSLIHSLKRESRFLEKRFQYAFSRKI